MRDFAELEKVNPEMAIELFNRSMAPKYTDDRISLEEAIEQAMEGITLRIIAEEKKGGE